MSGDIVFYRLNAKILESADDVPQDAREVVYYSLAIGHHVGVFDCFKPVLRCSPAFLEGLIAALPEGDARRKFDGIRRFGEITIDRTHTHMLAGAIDEARGRLNADQAAWCEELRLSLAAIEAEPAIYLMGRRR